MKSICSNEASLNSPQVINPTLKEKYSLNISLWNRVIAWEQRHSASADGIINFGGTRVKSGESHSLDHSGNSKVLTELDSSKIEVIVLDHQKPRELRISTTCFAVYL